MFEAIDSVVNSFTKTVAKLDKLAEKHHQESLDANDAMVKAEASVSTALKNRDRARKLAANINNLLV